VPFEVEREDDRQSVRRLLDLLDDEASVDQAVAQVAADADSGEGRGEIAARVLVRAGGERLAGGRIEEQEPVVLRPVEVHLEAVAESPEADEGAVGGGVVVRLPGDEVVPLVAIEEEEGAGAGRQRAKQD